MARLILILIILLSGMSFGKSIPSLPIIPPNIEKPSLPSLPNEDMIEIGGGTRVLEKNTTVMMNLKLDVVVPLEIVSDVDIEALVIDDQKLEVPFDVELNKTPVRKDYYSLKFSETEIDIDGDGQIDTTIYTPKFINSRIVDENILYIDGGKISKEGKHQRKVYMTIEVRE